MSDVVDFNGFKNKKIEKEQEHFDELTDSFKNDDIEFTEIAVELVYELVQQLREFDINIEENVESIRDIIMCIETVKGIINRVKHQSYPTCKMADHFYADKDCEKLMESFLDY